MFSVFSDDFPLLLLPVLPTGRHKPLSGVRTVTYNQGWEGGLKNPHNNSPLIAIHPPTHSKGHLTIAEWEAVS